MYSGSIPALITPFRDGNVDEQAFQNFIGWQIEQSSHGLVPCGTTGEIATLSFAEHLRVVELCAEAAAGRVPVIAGAGSNNTAHAIELAKAAKQARADAVLVVAPYYNRPNQEGLYAHFKAINDAVDIPIFVYNVPGRTVVDISVETIAISMVFHNQCGKAVVCISPLKCSRVGFRVQNGVALACRQVRYNSSSGRTEVTAIQ